MVCIQAGREGKRADLFIQLFHRSNFTERGAGVNGFGESLKPVLALLVYMPAGREGECTVFNCFIWCSHWLTF